MRCWLLRIFSALALIGFAAAVWFAGPLIGFADTRPLEPAWVRVPIIVVTVAAGRRLLSASASGGCARRRKPWRRQSPATRTSDGDSHVLEARMNEAIATLKRSSGKRNFLYELPWYIVIGPPGAGKTTALVNSGPEVSACRFGPGPAGRRRRRHALLRLVVHRGCRADRHRRALHHPGFGHAKPTRRAGWPSCRCSRSIAPRQPINGVILAISLEDLHDARRPGARRACDRNPQAAARKCTRMLKIDFPVYVLFTKADLVAGFMEYFGSFDEARRRKVWGATFQTADRHKNMVGETPAEFDAWRSGCPTRSPTGCTKKPDPVARISIFGFPAQFGLLKDAVGGFPRPRLRADALQGQRQPARLLFLLRHPGRHADRPGARRHRPQFRQQRQAPSFGHGQELLPARPADQGHLRRVRLGLARQSGREARRDRSLRRYRGDRAWPRRPCSAPGLELRHQQGADRVDRRGGRTVSRDGRAAALERNGGRCRPRKRHRRAGSVAQPAGRLRKPRPADADRRDVRPQPARTGSFRQPRPLTGRRWSACSARACCSGGADDRSQHERSAWRSTSR